MANEYVDIKFIIGTSPNIAFVKARQKEIGYAEVNNQAVVQVLGSQAMKSVPSQMLLRCVPYCPAVSSALGRQ